MLSQRVMHNKNTLQIFKIFNKLFIITQGAIKINKMVAFRMDWYSLISIRKLVSRAMLSKCIIILDHLSREVEQ